MTDRLEEIRARAEAATPGPWRELDAAYGMIVHDTGPDSAQIVVLADHRFGGPDSTFIAHAREDIPYLLAEVERLRAALGGVRGLLRGRGWLSQSARSAVTLIESALTEGGES